MTPTLFPWERTQVPFGRRKEKYAADMIPVPIPPPPLSTHSTYGSFSGRLRIKQVHVRDFAGNVGQFGVVTVGQNDDRELLFRKAAKAGGKANRASVMPDVPQTAIITD